MAAKPRGKAFKSSYGDDDLLDSLFDDKKHPSRGRATRSGPLVRSSATDNIFSMLAEEVKRDGDESEDSDVSAADPNDILKNMKDLDDMDAEIFAPKKKPSSAPARTTPHDNKGMKTDSPASKTNVKPEDTDKPAAEAKKPTSAPPLSTAQSYKKFNFSDSGGDDDEGVVQTPHRKDEEDPLADLLDDLLPDEPKSKSKPSTQRSKPDKAAPSPAASPALETETPKAANKRADITFDDEKDDLMDALGFESEKSTPKKKESVLWPNKERTEPPQRARTRLDEILQSLTPAHLLERPPTGEMKDQEGRGQEKTSEPVLEDDLTFGAYQPTLMSTPEGRQSLRQSVRFSTEDVSSSSPERKAKPTTPSSRHRNSADWLGLKTDDNQTFEEPETKENKTPTESTKTPAESTKTPSSPLTERRPPVSGSPAVSAAKTAAEPSALPDDALRQTTPEVFRSERRGEEEEDDWLAGALSRKKALTGSQSEAKTTRQEDSLNLEEETAESKHVTAAAPRGKEDAPTSVRETRNAAPVREKRTKPAVPPQTAGSVSHPDPPPPSLPSKGLALPQTSGQALSETSQHAPVLTPMSSILTDSLQQLFLQQQMMQSQLRGLGGVMDAGSLQREQQPVDYQALQARILQLEGQVKTLQLERDQSQFVLENIHQRHKQEMELMDNTHKAQVRRLEDLSAQRDTQAQQEREDLLERLAAVTKSAELEHSELQAQYQRKLTQAQQERDHEVERLRDLQKKSVLEMKRDHEDQIKRLKKLKEEEIDAVTSATSQTRSLTGVIEQMEHFSSRLGDLSSRVESTHEHTSQCLEKGARHRDEQLRMMQDRLSQKQKSMEEERAYLKEIISRMDTQLNEQQRQLEKERWKMTAEQAKAESTQRGLEDERRALSMQINMEREELERAKSALLEEQKSVMQQCAEERRKLAAEWTHFHTLEKQRHERAEREASSLLEKREGSIISLAQEQADLKLHTAELKQKEMVLSQERETLERLREELEREKDRMSSTALRLKTRAQEVEAFSKLAADKHEEGEQALQEAKRVEAEHGARLRNIQTQTERLRQNEQRILQERARRSHMQKDSENSVTFLPQMIQPVLPDAVSFLPNPDLTSTMNAQTPPPPPLADSQASALQASLALWRYTAEKDREYLQEEQIFLDSLKKKSYRSLFNAD
ncbi:fas-binding factor 1 homolog isoform X2 [Notolabrus celidotus]|uniref:fas-binding factor 1 homolog isoform X2 n=1 Tax=Notolabrus celidotus TaxID=1203425 RepID=UPI00148FBB4B|nr:fas-binding factor 1 homolog isoform X2 [Notolabrus celidotus]